MVDRIAESLTPEEAQKRRDAALLALHPPSWVWNEAETTWKAPKDPPTDGYPYVWEEESLDWIPFPGYPR